MIQDDIWPPANILIEKAAGHLATSVILSSIGAVLLFLFESATLGMAPGLKGLGNLAALVSLVSLVGLIIWTFRRNELALQLQFFVMLAMVGNTILVGALAGGEGLPELAAFLLIGITVGLVRGWKGMLRVVGAVGDGGPWLNRNGNPKSPKGWFIAAGVSIVMQVAVMGAVASGTVDVLSQEEMQAMMRAKQAEAREAASEAAVEEEADAKSGESANE